MKKKNANKEAMKKVLNYQYRFCLLINKHI